MNQSKKYWYDKFLIEINKSHRIKCDKYNFILQEKTNPKKCPEHLKEHLELKEDWDGSWFNVAYFKYFQNLYDYLFENNILKSTDGSIDDLNKKINNFKRWIKKILEQTDIEFLNIKKENEDLRKQNMVLLNYKSQVKSLNKKLKLYESDNDE